MMGVAIVAERGGSGKSSIAHALAFGAAWNQVPAYLVHTDDREPIKVDGRPYGYFDGRDMDKLKNLIDVALTSDGLFIVDSGGNRPVFDEWITDAMDLVVVPIMPDKEDVRTNLKHVERLQSYGRTNIRILLNGVSSNKFEADRIARVYAPVPQELVIGQTPHMPAIRILRDDDETPFKTPPSKVNHFARHVYRVISGELQQMQGIGPAEAIAS